MKSTAIGERGKIVKYRKRPVVIDAVQLCWANWNEVCEIFTDIVTEQNPARSVSTYSDMCGEDGPEYIELSIPTLEGVHTARHGDWLIRGIKGEVYPCKPDIFASTYEAVYSRSLTSQRNACGPDRPGRTA